MPKKIESTVPDWDKIPEDECKYITLNCPWTITSKDESLTVMMTCLKWTFNYDFCVRVTAHPQAALNISHQIDIDDHHPLLRSIPDALNLNDAFPQPHLKNHQLDFLGFLIEYLDLKFDCSDIVITYLAYPYLALDKFSGRDPEQDAQSFIQLIEKKINIALDDAPEHADELANYTFRKKALFSSLL